MFTGCLEDGKYPFCLQVVWKMGNILFDSSSIIWALATVTRLGWVMSILSTGRFFTKWPDSNWTRGEQVSVHGFASSPKAQHIFSLCGVNQQEPLLCGRYGFQCSCWMPRVLKSISPLRGTLTHTHMLIGLHPRGLTLALLTDCDNPWDAICGSWGTPA